MKLTFLGAAKTVTGSNFLLEAAGKKILIDCGMWQGNQELEDLNREEFEYNPAEIDFMLLTHAHIDHSGRIPKLYNQGFKNKVYAHKATCDLCALMLPDSGHIQEMESVWKNKKRLRKGLEELPPMYTAEDALRSLEIFEPVEYDQLIEITPEITIRYNNAGHMLGSSIIEIFVKEDGETKKLVFTGDLGNNDIPLLSEPTMIESADYLVMESTYGSRLHLRNDEKARLFLDIVSETVDNGGTVVIPSFAVGRTQEILYEIDKLKALEDNEEFSRKYKVLMQTPVYVDSPLAISATEVFRENMDLFEDEIKEKIIQGDNPLEFPGLKFTRTADESKALNDDPRPSIIISASGMCEVGRIKHHLKHQLWNPKSTILFVGYQAPGTLGHSIVNGAKNVKIFGDDIAVNARVEYIEGFSGHADQEWLMNFIYSFREKPKHIFLVHGEEDSQDVLQQKILIDTGITSTIPSYGESYELNEELTKTVIEIKQKPMTKEKALKSEVLMRLEKLSEEMKDMKTFVQQDVANTTLSEREIYSINEKIKEIEKQIVKVIEG